MVARIVQLQDVSPHPVVQRVREHYEAANAGRSGHGFYKENSWRRFSYALGRLRHGGRVLDVGVYTGQVIDVLALCGWFERVVGIDRVRPPHFTAISNDLDIRIMNAAQLEFADGEFDVVVCMEVLEHLEEEDFAPALRELRRVCGRQLLMSVPYNEREPLSPNHRRRFTDDDLRRLFPTADMTLLVKPDGVPAWVMLEERGDGSLSSRAWNIRRRVSRRSV